MESPDVAGLALSLAANGKTRKLRGDRGIPAQARDGGNGEAERETRGCARVEGGAVLTGG